MQEGRKKRVFDILNEIPLIMSFTTNLTSNIGRENVNFMNLELWGMGH